MSGQGKVGALSNMYLFCRPYRATKQNLTRNKKYAPNCFVPFYNPNFYCSFPANWLSFKNIQKHAFTKF